MQHETIVGLGVGAAFLVIGFLLTTREGVARWGLTHGRGRVWVALLGMERAMKLTRYFFGPLVALLGLIAVAMGISGLLARQ